MTEDVVVTMEHLRKANYCARGVRTFFDRYGLDYVDFLKNGIRPELLLQVSDNDWMAQQAVEIARGER